MPSNASRGAYYKARTRKWLAGLGYQVVDLEVVRWVHRPGGAGVPVKRDQLGSDLMGVRADHLVFIQVKGGAQAAGDGQFPSARREFEKYRFPRWAHVWIVAWAPRARAPRVVRVQEGRAAE